MKKWLAMIAGLSLMLTGCGGSNTEETASTYAKQLNIYNWSEYLPQTVIDQFEKKYGIKVNYSTYSSNEEMLAKIMAGGAEYDLSVASDYMVDIMKKQNLLELMDVSQIPNFKNIGEQYKKLYFDPENQYTVPYMAGSALIAYNKKKVSKPITDYADLWDPSLNNNMVVLDDERALIGIALKKLGYSFNDTDQAHLDAAKAELIKLKPNIKAFDSDSPKTLLINGEVTVGYVWSAEAADAARENKDIEVVIPKSSVYLWQDNFIIPKGAKNKRTAQLFINFILEPEISAQITNVHPYTNPNDAAKQFIKKEFLDNKAIFLDDATMKNGEYLKDMGNMTSVYDGIWNEFKESK